MNLLQPRRAEVERIGTAVSDTFDAFSAKISAVWGIEHHPDGTHADITADSMTVETLSVTDSVTVTEDITVGDDATITGHLTADSAAITNALVAGSIVTGTILMTSTLTVATVTASGGTLTLTGILSVTSHLNVGGTITVNSGTFTITGSTGNAVAAGSILSTHATRGVGYTTGAGGTQTQQTNKTTGVTLNTITGQITMNNAALGSLTFVSFVVTNSAVAAVDVVIVNVISGGTANAYVAAVTAVAAGSFTITVQNITGGSLSEAPVIGFAVVKGATS